MDLDKLLKASNKILGAIEKTLLTPLSWIYGAGVWLRQVGFNTGLLKQEEFDVPVVTIGNVTVGGTGKTPHVEYIVSRLCRKYEIAVLSRGYKRHTKGFVLASDNLSPVDLGDEPYQIYRKFRGMVTVAVCEEARHQELVANKSRDKPRYSRRCHAAPLCEAQGERGDD